MSVASGASGDGVERSGVDISVAMLLLTFMMLITGLFAVISLSLVDLVVLFNDFARKSLNITVISSFEDTPR